MTTQGGESKWEYKVLDGGPSEWQINQAALQGWEIVQVTPETFWSYRCVYLRRRKR